MSNKNNEINKWKIKDVITTVLLSILLIAIQLIINMICMANHFVSMVLSIGFTMLLCGPVYCLILHRVRKHFVTLTYMTIIGIIFLLMGNWYLLPFFIFVGIICECILWKDVSLRKAKQVTASWTAASLMYNGINLFPIWFFWDTYYEKRHGTELYQFIRALLYQSKMDNLHFDFYHCDGFYRQPDRK